MTVTTMNQREKERVAMKDVRPRTMAMTLDVGQATDDVEVFEKKTGKVTVTRHEHGWTIVGGSTIWWESDGETPWQKFTAEIGDCRSCNSDSPYARIRPVCETNHTAKPSESHAGRFCHEPGHVERVRALAEKIVGSY